MDNTGRRFKTENDEPTRIFEVDAPEPSARDEAKAERAAAKAERAAERSERQKTREAKAVERMMAKERHSGKASGRRDHDAPVSESEADAAAQEPIADNIPAPEEKPDTPSAVEPEEKSDTADTSAADNKDKEPEQKHSIKDRDERLKDKNAKKLDKLMKKKRRREENTERDVLSYEDMPLEEREKKQSSSKRRFNKKRITVAVIILLVLIFIVFVFTNNDKLSLHNISNFVTYGIFNSDSDQRFPIEIQGESGNAGNFRRMGQDLCFASDTKLQTLNNYGKRMLTVQHGFTSPVLVCSDKYSVLYNLGGTGFQINGLDKSVYSGTAEHGILVADINNDGVYALVTQSDGYLSKLTVYEKDNSKIYSYSFANYYITSVSLSSNGRMAVLSGVSALNGSEISSLYVLDFTKEAPQQFAELEDTIIYDVSYLNDTYAAAVGSAGAYCINTGNGNVELTSYEGKTLTAYNFNTDTDTFSVSLSRSGDGRNCDIYSFNTNGTVSKSFSTDLKVISLSTYKGRVALLTSDSVYLYDKGGSQVSVSEAGVDPRCVVLYTSSDAYVLDTSEIRSVAM